MIKIITCVAVVCAIGYGMITLFKWTYERNSNLKHQMSACGDIRHKHQLLRGTDDPYELERVIYEYIDKLETCGVKYEVPFARRRGNETFSRPILINRNFMLKAYHYADGILMEQESLIAEHCK